MITSRYAFELEERFDKFLKGEITYAELHNLTPSRARQAKHMDIRPSNVESGQKADDSNLEKSKDVESK